MLGTGMLGFVILCLAAVAAVRHWGTHLFIPSVIVACVWLYCWGIMVNFRRYEGLPYSRLDRLVAVLAAVSAVACVGLFVLSL
jgi:hypothetical protein